MSDDGFLHIMSQSTESLCIDNMLARFTLLLFVSFAGFL